jgi:hypothetical protein
VFAEDVPQFKVTVTIENLRAQTSRVFRPIEVPQLVRDFLTPDAHMTEILIDVEDDESLGILMNDLGISL